MPLPTTSDEAWQHLLGTWTFTLGGGHSVSVSKLTFTPDRKLIMSSLLTGGVLPIPMTNERTEEVAAIEVKENRVLLTLKPHPQWPLRRNDVPMTLFLMGQDRINVEGEGPVHTREKAD